MHRKAVAECRRLIRTYLMRLGCLIVRHLHAAEVPFATLALGIRLVEKTSEVNFNVTNVGEEKVRLEIEARLETRTRNASS